MDDPLAKYLAEVAAVHASGAGVPETSYYPALSNLFNDVGKRLTPRVRAIINLSNRGAGLPDGGFFTADQFEKKSGGAPGSTSPAPLRAAGNSTTKRCDVRPQA
jgi:hypothetical protein